MPVSKLCFLLEPFLLELVVYLCHRDDVLERACLCRRSPPLRHISPLGSELCWFFFDMFLRTIFIGRAGASLRGSPRSRSFLSPLRSSCSATTFFQSDGGCHFVHHLYLLACAVDEFELHVGEHYGERYARKAAAGAEVEHLAAVAEGYFRVLWRVSAAHGARRSCPCPCAKSR